MINPGELRIGNLLKINDLFVTVNRIEKDRFWATYKERLFFRSDECSSIPLTEDVLLKCGFRKLKLEGYDVHFKYTHPKLHSSITAIYNADFSMKLDDVARGIKYLHQLQNLFFTLTNVELELNL